MKRASKSYFRLNETCRNGWTSDLVNAIRNCRLETTAIGLELLLVLFPRPGELRAARWDQFNFETRVWLRPADLMKRRVAHAIPLPKQAIKLLLRLKEISGDGNEYLFPSRSNSNEKFKYLTWPTICIETNGVYWEAESSWISPHCYTFLNDIFSDKGKRPLNPTFLIFSISR